MAMVYVWSGGGGLGDVGVSRENCTPRDKETKEKEEGLRSQNFCR